MAGVDIASRVAIGVVFAVAVTSKLRSRAAFTTFARSLTDVPLLRPVNGSAPAVILVLGEATLVVALAFPPLGAVGYALALVLLAIYELGIAHAVALGERVKCRCFGAASSYLGPRQLLRNGLLLAVAAIGLAADLASRLGGVSAQGLVVAIAAGLFAALLFVAWDDLAFLVTGAADRRASEPDRGAV